MRIATLMIVPASLFAASMAMAQSAATVTPPAGENTAQQTTVAPSTVPPTTVPPTTTPPVTTPPVTTPDAPPVTTPDNRETGAVTAPGRVDNDMLVERNGTWWKGERQATKEEIAAHKKAMKDRRPT